MTLLTIKNVAVLGIGVFGVAMIADALPGTGSSALAQNSVVRDVSTALQQMVPDPNAPTADSLANLLRVADRTYQVDFDNSISSEVLSSSVVRKIAFGSTSLVTIVSTSSGTYSTDGFTSPHVLYPGVSVADVTKREDFADFKILLNGEFVDGSLVAQDLNGS